MINTMASESAGSTNDESTWSTKELQLDVHLLSGRSATLSIRTTASPREVCVAIEELLGIPSHSQQWLRHSKEIWFQKLATMADTGLNSGDQITVMNNGFVPLVPLPNSFVLNLTSIRQRFRGRYSSSFTVLYKIRGSLSAEWLYFEPWRKNDHDKLLFDHQAGIMVAETSHWMAGSSTHRTSLGELNPLGKLSEAWCSPPVRIVQDADRFWLTDRSSDTLVEEIDVDGDQTRPNYQAVPGWFIAPSEHLNEIEVSVPLPSRDACSTRIIRLLIDQKGEPVRAAVQGCKIGGLHQDIEEFEITLEGCDNIVKPIMPGEKA
jgi:hypothetical protein